jgi:hypothetical protein
VPALAAEVPIDEFLRIATAFEERRLRRELEEEEPLVTAEANAPVCDRVPRGEWQGVDRIDGMHQRLGGSNDLAHAGDHVEKG